MAIGALIAGAGIGAAGNLLSAGLNAGMTAWQNSEQRKFDANQAQLERDFNANQAQLGRDFNAEQAQINRDWQTNMSNTAYQRAKADMESAGLNPALMYGANSASTPSGSAASGGSASAGPGARSHQMSYAQSAQMVAGAFGTIGQYFTQRAEAMTAQQAAHQLFADKEALKNMDYAHRQDLEKLRHYFYMDMARDRRLSGASPRSW